MNSLKSPVTLLAGAVLMSITLTAWAQSGVKPKPPGGPTSAIALTTARGVVKSVSSTRLVLDTGQAGSGSELRLALDERTIVQRGVGKPIAVKDLKAGDPVTVAYAESDGKAVAKRIWVRSSDAPATAGSPGGSKGR